MKFIEHIDAEFNGKLKEKHVKVPMDHKASKQYGNTDHFQEQCKILQCLEVFVIYSLSLFRDV